MRNPTTYRQKKASEIHKEYFTFRSMFGYSDCFFFIAVGAREAGKSFDCLNVFLREWKREGKSFTWLRLKESSQKKLLANKAAEFVDAELLRIYDLDLTVKGNQVYDHGKPMCKILALSTFYNDKGVAMYDSARDLGYNIALDEMNFEVGERKTLDIPYAFVNQMENLVRSTKKKLRIVIIGNDTDECSDILSLFGYIPEEFGRYHIKKKKCVIDYIPPTAEYLARRKGTVADILMPEASTFSNKTELDVSLIDKRRLCRPSYVVKFNKTTMFTVWDGKIVAKYQGEKVQVVSMRPYLDEVFNVELRDMVLAQYDVRSYHFRDLLTQRMFKKELELLRPKK